MFSCHACHQLKAYVKNERSNFVIGKHLAIWSYGLLFHNSLELTREKMFIWFYPEMFDDKHIFNLPHIFGPLAEIVIGQKLSSRILLFYYFI